VRFVYIFLRLKYEKERNMKEFVRAFQTDMLIIWKLFALWLFSVIGAVLCGSIIHMWFVLVLWR